MNIAVSGKCWLDCTNQGGNKGSALQHFQEAYKISPDETLAFGDNINDIEMLKRASHSFAVENAREEVKEAANFIAPSYKEDGVLYTCSHKGKELNQFGNVEWFWLGSR